LHLVGILFPHTETELSYS